VTITTNADGSIILGNGIVSLTIDPTRARLASVTYTYNNTGTAQTTEMLAGKGQYYWGGEVFAMGNGQYKTTIAADPTSNGGNFGDVMEVSDSPTRGLMEIHFSMLRGSPGYYSTGIQTHRPQDGVMGLTAWGVVTRVPTEFNWLSADEWRNFFIGEQTTKSVGIPNSPHEISVCLDGAKASELDDKFIYGQDHGDQHAWGWSSVGKDGLNVGVWMMTNMDFSDGGPLKRDVGVYCWNELNNSILTGELGMGSDGNFAEGEPWTKTCGPFFIYMNNVLATVTDPAKAARALYDDALAQADAEKAAWPYTWFKNDKYPQASGRGTVEGKFVINDSGNPGASAAGLWVGLEQQPLTNKGMNDFQKWLKPYQYWVKTDADGSFKFSNVLPGDNYTLFAFGRGAAGTYLSQNLKDANPPMECNVPAKPFAVTVTAGSTNQLGEVPWTPLRLGATVFELGYPDRLAGEFRHGENFWTPAKTPKLGYPLPIWGGQMQFPVDFPDGMTYTVGKSRWSTDWNYCLPSMPDPTGAYQAGTGTINFNLAQAPASTATASLYIASAGDEGGHVMIIINGTNLDTATNITATPDALNSPQERPYGKGIGGYNPPDGYSDDSSIHFGDHGPFSDERITFPASMLHAGQNSIVITENAKDMTSNIMLDYLRLEMAGYVPPAPGTVNVFAGNNRAMVGWPVVPGATSYNVLRTTTAGSAYTPVATNLAGPVCGSDVSMATYVDSTAANGTQYYYAVQSVNPVGHSVNSADSAGVTPAETAPAAAPSAPQGLALTNSGHHTVSLQWTAVPEASYYVVSRCTQYRNGLGGTYPLRTVVLQDALADTHYTDTTPTDGDLYNYTVQAVNAAGTSAPSTGVDAAPNPAPPATAPQSFAGKWEHTRDGDVVVLNWAPVPGAVGYVLYRVKVAAKEAGEGTDEGADQHYSWPENFKTTIVETTYTDKPNKKFKIDDQKSLNPEGDYWYQVTAVNTAGISPSASIHVGTKQAN
jgi:rhamnogalacturonan endolyase